MAYIPLRKAVDFLGLHPNTLRKYADEGKISYIKNEAGQRLYDVESYRRDAAKPSVVCYCRVSSAKQKDDPQDQRQRQTDRPRAPLLCLRQASDQDADEDDVVDAENDLEHRQRDQGYKPFGRKKVFHAKRR